MSLIHIGRLLLGSCDIQARPSSRHSMLSECSRPNGCGLTVCMLKKSHEILMFPCFAVHQGEPILWVDEASAGELSPAVSSRAYFHQLNWRSAQNLLLGPQRKPGFDCLTYQVQIHTRCGNGFSHWAPCEFFSFADCRQTLMAPGSNGGTFLARSLEITSWLRGCDGEYQDCESGHLPSWSPV